MDAVRCLDCGDVRWSLMGLKGRPANCRMCGGKMVPERRRPAGSHLEPGERRDLAAADVPPDRLSGLSTAREVRSRLFPGD